MTFLDVLILNRNLLIFFWYQISICWLFQMVETDTADSTFVVTDLQPFTVFFFLTIMIVELQRWLLNPPHPHNNHDANQCWLWLGLLLSMLIMVRCTLINADHGQVYSFKVTAVNKIGASSQSQPSYHMMTLRWIWWRLPTI